MTSPQIIQSTSHMQLHFDAFYYKMHFSIRAQNAGVYGWTVIRAKSK